MSGSRGRSGAKRVSGADSGVSRLLSVTDPTEVAREAASVLAERSGVPAHDTAVVLGALAKKKEEGAGAPAEAAA